MIKIRTMKVNADKSGVDSTSANDNRITPIGHFIRKFKLDELTQLLKKSLEGIGIKNIKKLIKNTNLMFCI